jgi:6-phosphogluconolactonase
VGTAGGIKNPSFLAIHPSGRFLYAVCEVNDLAGKPGGGVTAFSLDGRTGRLSLLNQQTSGGKGPCHLVVDATGTNVLVANYGGGSVAVLPIGEDGRLKEPSCFIQHAGSSVNPRRQQGPHAHSINVDPGNRFAMVADLGLDKVLVYRFDARRGQLEPNDPPSVALKPGAGPRHFSFHPDGHHAYVINELHSTITALGYDAQRGKLTAIQTVSTLPAGFEGNNSTAEVQVHPSGRFVYGSNRGHDSIAIFAVDAPTGKLTPVGHELTQGETPRNFALDPTGTWLLAENQRTGTVVVFRIDQQTGKLSATGQVLEIPSPVCIKFLAVSAR